MDKQKTLPTGNKSVQKKNEGRMSLMGHLGEFRKRLTKIVGIVLLTFIVSYLFIEPIVTALVNLGTGFEFIYTSPTELLTTYIKISFIMGLVLASPFIAFEIWAFVKPGLKPNEKRVGLGALVAGLGFFLVGALFAYFVMIPFTLNFLLNFDTVGLIDPLISFSNYISYIVSTLVAMGLVFEMPVLSVMLTSLGILKPTLLVKARKYAILVIFIIAAIITPPDVISQVMVGIPMIILYEISIALSKRVFAKKQARAAAEEAGEDADKDQEVSAKA